MSSLTDKVDMVMSLCFRISCVGLLLICFIRYVPANVDVNISANIISNTCSISVENNGYIPIPIVGPDYFHGRGNPPIPLQPTDDVGGTPFKVKVADCDSNTEGDANHLHFSFQPQSGTFTQSTKQVFINEASDGARNVGLVVFDGVTHSNVLKADGTSDVIFDVSGKGSDQYLTDYLFYARYQNTGPISAGKVSSHVLVSVVYD